MTKIEAVNKSIKKWERIIRRLKWRVLFAKLFPWLRKPYSVGLFRGECGFCDYMEENASTYSSCQECPLFIAWCNDMRPAKGRRPLFWRVVDGETTQEQLKLACQMLKEIKTRGEKWIKL